MKIRTRILQASTVFPPVLALLVGGSLIWRGQREDEVRQRFAAARRVAQEAFLLSEAACSYAEGGDARARWEWETRSREVTSYIKAQVGAEGRGAGVQAALEDVKEVFTAMMEDRRSGGVVTGDSLKKILKRLGAVVEGMFDEAQAAHEAASGAQQMTDAVLIVLCSLLAVGMGIAGYAAVREELAERQRVDQALRQSDVQLSDAVLRLRRARQQIIQQERLRRLEETARDVIHDCRNSMTPILTTSEFLLSGDDKLEDKNGVRECAALIHRAATKMTSTVSRLGDFVGSEPTADKKPVDVNRLVAGAIEWTRPKWEERPSWLEIRVKTELQDVPSVWGREGELSEALRNIVVNAIEAMPKGGVLSFRTRAEGGEVVLRVGDTGVGMSEEVRRRSLDPFFSTKGEGHAGIGLAVAYGVVLQEGGRMTIESRPGGGTTVEMVFLAGEGADAAQGEAGGMAAAVAPARVLMIDDEAWSRGAIAHCLLEDGHMVDTAAGGREGLERFREGTYDVVITDRAMPDMNGEEVAAAIKKMRPGTPVMLLTGFAEAGRDGTGTVRGVDTVVSKPVTREGLRQAMAAVMGAARGRG